MNGIILIGGGGHGKVVLDALLKEGKFHVCGILDPALPVGQRIFGIEVLGGDDMLTHLYGKGIRHAAVGIGTIGSYDRKWKVWRQVCSAGFKLPPIVHPASCVAHGVKLGDGSFIAAGTVIAPDVVIGDGSIINTRVSIDHDSRIGRFSHIAPGAVLCGDVQVGEEVHIGAGAIIIQGCKIPNGSFVKVGERVIKDIMGSS